MRKAYISDDDRKDIIHIQNLLRKAVVELYPDFIDAVKEIKGSKALPIIKPLKK